MFAQPSWDPSCTDQVTTSPPRALAPGWPPARASVVLEMAWGLGVREQVAGKHGCFHISCKG